MRSDDKEAARAAEMLVNKRNCVRVMHTPFRRRLLSWVSLGTYAHGDAAGAGERVADQAVH